MSVSLLVVNVRYKSATVTTAFIGIAVYLAIRGNPFIEERPFEQIRASVASPAQTSANNRSARGSPMARVVGQSRAPWADRRKRFDNRDFAWLVKTAYDAPEEGSYVLASRALSTCRALYLNGTLAEQAGRMANDKRFSSAINDERKRALLELFDACQPLGSSDEMLAMLKRLSRLTKDGPDAIENTLQKGNEVPNMPEDARRRLVAELLGMNDPVATHSIMASLTAPGAMLNGVEIGRFDLPIYRAAWNLTMCAQYGECGGADSTEGLQECIQWGSCDYADTWTKVDRAYPAILRGRIQGYFLAIRANLQSGNFGAFGTGNFQGRPGR